MRQGTGGRSATRWGQGGAAGDSLEPGGGRATVTRRRQGGGRSAIRRVSAVPNQKPAGRPIRRSRCAPAAFDPAKPSSSGCVRFGPVLIAMSRQPRSPASLPFPARRGNRPIGWSRSGGSRFPARQGGGEVGECGRGCSVYSCARMRPTSMPCVSAMPWLMPGAGSG